jgi:hypothetical protein
MIEGQAERVLSAFLSLFPSSCLHVPVARSLPFIPQICAFLKTNFERNLDGWARKTTK